MAASKRLRQLDRQLELLAKPMLAAHGFVAGKRRVFRRRVEHEGTVSTQIIEFQVGVRSLAGRFTVNLAVFNRTYARAGTLRDPDAAFPFDCPHELTQRLGFFVPPRRSVLDWLLQRRAGPRDHWWEQDEDEGRMVATLKEVLELLTGRGISWLEQKTSLEVLDRRAD